MAHHVFRRGLVSGSPYADIVATNPTLFVPLQYESTSADGQILYQDSGATTPVTTAGDPVGAVKWNGTVVASQTTDADRPIWQGSSRGVAFSGGQHLIETGVAGVSTLHEQNGELFISGSVDSTQTGLDTGGIGTWFATDQGGADGNGIFFSWNNYTGGGNDHQMTWGVTDAGTFTQSKSSIDAIDDSLEHTASVTWDYTANEVRYYVDGTLFSTDSITISAPSGAAQFNGYIGQSPEFDRPLVGDLKAVVAFDTELNASDRDDVESALAGLL